MTGNVLRVGTRGSPLALVQARRVIKRLQQAHPQLRGEVRVVKTAGDREQRRPLAEMGGEGVFVGALEGALLRGEIDCAVHSLKDVPTEVPTELVLAAYPERADPHDVLVSREGWTVEGLPRGARIGTGSARRRGQLLHCRPDLRVLPIRGNLETRTEKMLAGRYDALVLARAGLVRLGRPGGVVVSVIPFDVMLPSSGQGTLAVEARRDDRRTRRLLTRIDDPDLALAASLERLVLYELGAGCHGGVGVLARVGGETVLLRAAVVAPDGATLIRARARGPKRRAQRVARQVLSELWAQGAAQLITPTAGA